MDTRLLESKFARMGARLAVTDRPSRRGRPVGAVSLDVRTDRRGEFFELAIPPAAPTAIDVLDLRPPDRHLLLLVREGGLKDKFLCGHDERHWFVAGVPEAAPVGTVRQAMEALKPAEVLAAQVGKGLRGDRLTRRKNAAFVRQGEWFFLPEPAFVADPRLVLRDEPLTRGNGGKPHWAEFCYRYGGELVYVSPQFANGLTEAQYRALLGSKPSAKGWRWRAMRRNPRVYVRGRVRHPDHATIALHGWHRVVMNTEGQSRAMRNIAFLD